MIGKILDPRGIGRTARPTREGYIPVGMSAKENRRSQERGAEWSAEIIDRPTSEIDRAEVARSMIQLFPEAALRALENNKLTREQKKLLLEIFGSRGKRDK